jgi:hypothetical protein
MRSFLPPDAVEIIPRSSTIDAANNVISLISDLKAGFVKEHEIEAILNAIPRDIMRNKIYQYSGLDASFLATLKQQIRLIDTVVSQMIHTDGTLKPASSEFDMSLKDVLNLSAKVTQMMLRDLPRIYNLERVAKMEQAIGDIMEEYLSPELQDKVLRRLEELSATQT